MTDFYKKKNIIYLLITLNVKTDLFFFVFYESFFQKTHLRGDNSYGKNINNGNTCS